MRWWGPTSIMPSKYLLQNIFHTFSKWNFFKPRKSKVHPSLEEGRRKPDDNSSSDSDEEQAVGLWQDFIEEYDCLLKDSEGKKAGMYMLDDRPLVHQVVTGGGLHGITEEIIHTFGLQVLNIVLDVICDPTVNREKDTLEDILNRMELLDFAKWRGQKLFVWLEDFPSPETGDSDLLGRLIITELMRRKIEPQMVIPCHDMDSRLTRTVKSVMRKDLKTTISHEEDVLADWIYESSMFHVSLRIALASENCNIVLVDASQQFIDTPSFRDFTEFARNLGHEVLFVRHTPCTNKYWTVHDFANRVEEWVRAKSKYVDVSYDSDEDQLVVPRREMLHKLTSSHFVRERSVGGNGDEGSESDSDVEDGESVEADRAESGDEEEDSSESSETGTDDSDEEDDDTESDDSDETSETGGDSTNDDQDEDPYASDFDSDAS